MRTLALCTGIVASAAYAQGDAYTEVFYSSGSLRIQAYLYRPPGCSSWSQSTRMLSGFPPRPRWIPSQPSKGPGHGRSRAPDRPGRGEARVRGMRPVPR